MLHIVTIKFCVCFTCFFCCIVTQNMILTLLLNLSIMLTKIILTIIVTIVAFFIIAIIENKIIKKIAAFRMAKLSDSDLRKYSIDKANPSICGIYAHALNKELKTRFGSVQS